jgi:hypothetical protein
VYTNVHVCLLLCVINMLSIISAHVTWILSIHTTRSLIVHTHKDALNKRKHAHTILIQTHHKDAPQQMVCLFVYACITSTHQLAYPSGMLITILKGLHGSTGFWGLTHPVHYGTLHESGGTSPDSSSSSRVRHTVYGLAVTVSSGSTCHQARLTE